MLKITNRTHPSLLVPSSSSGVLRVWFKFKLWHSSTYSVRTSCHSARFTLDSDLSPHILYKAHSTHCLITLVVNYINYNCTSLPSSAVDRLWWWWYRRCKVNLSDRLWLLIWYIRWWWWYRRCWGHMGDRIQIMIVDDNKYVSYIKINHNIFPLYCTMMVIYLTNIN